MTVKLFPLANRILGTGIFGLIVFCGWAEDANPSGVPVVLGPGLTVNSAKHEVLMDATVCLRMGVLEYITCRPGGRQSYQHESIFSSTVTPSLVHAGLLLIGLEPHEVKTSKDLKTIPQDNQSRLSVMVEFELGGKLQRRPLSDWLVNLEKPTTPVPNIWIFTGSKFVEENGQSRYAADILGHIIGLTSLGFGVIQFGERVAGDVNPHMGWDQTQGMRLDSSLVPEVGTKVRLIFSPRIDQGTRPAEASAPDSPTSGAAGL